jgi:CheY-like chemotaxis protein
MARILIVDDDELDRTLLRAMLSGEGHEVIQAVDGEEGFAFLGETSIDVVVTDLQMPKVLDRAEAIGADASLASARGRQGGGTS